MSFPKYPKYKPSGTDWLGDVPEHWEVIAIKHRFQIYGGSTPKSEKEEYWDGNILWATPADLSKLESLYISDTERKITESGLSSCNTTLAPAGSIVLSTRAPIGSLAITTKLLCTNQGCKTLIPSNKANSKFFAYVLSASTAELNIRGRGTTFLELSGDELRAFKVPIPPLPEQTQIANFLDRETAKIDALVSEQRRLMELLKEKRQAVISHAVTRGLNPSAPLKPSGIDWLGDIPAHWSALSIRRCCERVQTGGTPAEYPPERELTDGMVWFTPGDFGESLLLSCSERRIPLTAISTGEAKIFPAGSVLVVSIGATLGKVGYVQCESSGNQQINAIIPSQLLDGYFLTYSLSTKTDVMRFLSNASTIGIMNQEKTKDIIVAVPPLDEQTAIVRHLDTETAKFDALTAEAERAITLLQERRTALISATVTGQIDLKNYFHPQMMQTCCR